MPSVTYRHPSESDGATMAAVWNDSKRDNPAHKTITLAELMADTFEDGDYDPAGAWLAFDGDSAVAYADAFIDKTRREFGKNDGFVMLDVVHSSRGRGIEHEMLEMVFAYMKGRGVDTAQGWSEESDKWKAGALQASGFKEVRRFYLMKREKRGRSETPKYPQGIELQRVMLNGDSEEDIATVVNTRNKAFVDHFNYSPATLERWKNMIQASEEVHHVTFARSQGKVAGFVLSEDRVAYSKEAGIREGWVMTLGVVGEHRRKGLGRALLLESVNWLTDRGVDLIRLGVDAKNRKALDLYTSVGFEIENESIFMLKDLRQ